MFTAPQNRFTVSTGIKKPKTINKGNFPLRYGKFSEIRTANFEFRFNLNGEIKFIRGLDTSWPHPAEQLKRTDGNDWVYYSVGDRSGDKGVVSWLGEYYLPCLSYPSNPVWDVDFRANPAIMQAFAAWSQLFADIHGANKIGLHPKAKDLLAQIKENHDLTLHKRAQELFSIIGERISVLPPDTRHADYEVIPLIIADGCLYHCDFCCVKSSQGFKPRSREQIIEQISRLKVFYGRNLENLNALFLGNHDALAAGEETVLFALEQTRKSLGLAPGGSDVPMLFMFASVDSLLKSKERLYQVLSGQPFKTYINIGLESADPSTLAAIGKPVSAAKVEQAMQKMGDINSRFDNLELTGNFLIGRDLSPEHYQATMDLLGNASVTGAGKGAIYLSPIQDSPKKRELLPRIQQIKEQSGLPVFVYLIQRL